MRAKVLPRSGDGRSKERDRHAVSQQAPEHRDSPGGVCHQDGGRKAGVSATAILFCSLVTRRREGGKWKPILRATPSS